LKEFNRRNISWLDANKYAEDLRLGGYSDWRLPTLDELKKLYDPDSGNKNQHPEAISIDGRPLVWTSTKEGPGSPRDFLVGSGKRNSPPMFGSAIHRALCVRGSGK
jgi:hypothetical protein